MDLIWPLKCAEQDLGINKSAGVKLLGVKARELVCLQRLDGDSLQGNRDSFQGKKFPTFLPHELLLCEGRPCQQNAQDLRLSSTSIDSAVQ